MLNCKSWKCRTVAWCRRRRYWTGAILILLGLLTASGCERKPAEPPALVEVHGQVNLDGTPVAGARIVFVPENIELSSHYRLAYGTTDKQGRFSLMLADDRTGAFPGRNRVFISTADLATPELESEPESVSELADMIARSVIPGISADSSEIGAAKGSKGEQIPYHYNSQSDLTCDVLAGSGLHEVQFELSSIDPLLLRDSHKSDE